MCIPSIGTMDSLPSRPVFYVSVSNDHCILFAKQTSLRVICGQMMWHIDLETRSASCGTNETQDEMMHGKPALALEDVL